MSPFGVDGGVFSQPRVGGAASASRRCERARGGQTEAGLKPTVDSSGGTVRMKLASQVAFGVIAATLTLSTALSGAALAGTLSETVQFAISTHPDVKEAAANRRATEAELREARGLYYPRLDARAGIGPEWSLNTTTSPRPGGWLGRMESDLTLQQLLFDGFAREGEVEKRASRVDAASYRVRERSEVIALNSTQAYLDVLRNQELVQLAKDNVDIHQGITDDVRSRVQGGQSGIGDQQQAEARLATAKNTLIRAEKDLEDATASFIRFVGEAPSDLVLPELSEALLPASVDDAVGQSRSNNPAIRAVGADIDVTHGERRVVEGDFYPTFRVEITGSRNRHIDGTQGPNHDFLAMLRMQWNLFNGGQTTARKMEAIERITESREAFLGVQRLIEESVRLAWIATENAKRESLTLNDLVLANSQVVSTYRQEFEIGQRDLLDLLDSENELFLARSRLITADFVVMFGKYRILADTGKLLDGLDLKVMAEQGTGYRAGAGVHPDWQPGKGLTK